MEHSVAFLHVAAGCAAKDLLFGGSGFVGVAFVVTHKGFVLVLGPIDLWFIARRR